MKKSMIVYCIIMSVMLLTIVGLLIYKNTFKLVPFKIVEVNQTLNTLTTLEFEKNKNADTYLIEVYLNNNKIKEISSNKNKIKLEQLAKYNQELTIKVYAINKKNKLKAVNDLDFTWKLPSLEIEDTNIINNNDLKIKVLFDTDFKDNSYWLKLKQNDKILLEQEIKDKEVIISKDILKNILGDCTLQLFASSDLKAEILYKENIKLVLPQITDIELLKPTNNEEIKWDDFEITFKGGSNATDYNINILENETSIINENIKEKKYKLDISKLKENTLYKLIITASNDKDEGLTKKIETNFKTKSKEKASTVVSSINSGNIYKGNKITLSTSTNNSTIYYTLDGSNPTTNSIKYDNGIIVNNNMTIKAVAVSKNYFNSEIATFNYKVVAKPISIYLSPSNQTWNIGIQGIGYTNESVIMNKLANVVEPILKNKGFTVYRNKPNMSLDEIVDQSKSLNVDLHLALHSNASATPGSMTGIETYVYSKNSVITPLAQKLHSSMNSIYYKTNPRKIIYGLEDDYVLREINPKRVNNGILIEVAYHDQETDAKWILNNINKIGTTIANSVASYYGK